MEFTLNGKKVSYNADPALPVLTYLREVAGIKSAKDGCSGQGACGCCTVQMDDKAILSCKTTMAQIEGTNIVTTEGLAKPVQKAFADAFVAKGGAWRGS